MNEELTDLLNKLTAYEGNEEMMEQVREFVSYLSISTDEWVLPPHFYGLMDDEKYREAWKILDGIEGWRTDDREYVRAHALLAFLDGTKDGPETPGCPKAGQTMDPAGTYCGCEYCEKLRPVRGSDAHMKAHCEPIPEEFDD